MNSLTSKLRSPSARSFTERLLACKPSLSCIIVAWLSSLVSRESRLSLVDSIASVPDPQSTTSLPGVLGIAYRQTIIASASTGKSRISAEPDLDWSRHRTEQPQGFSFSFVVLQGLSQLERLPANSSSGVLPGYCSNSLTRSVKLRCTIQERKSLLRTLSLSIHRQEELSANRDEDTILDAVSSCSLPCLKTKASLPSARPMGKSQLIVESD